MEKSQTPNNGSVDRATAPSSNNNPQTATVNNKGGPTSELISKTPKKRVIGISRKILLRTINRKIIVRLARRATIGIPMLGLYLGQKVFRTDLSDAINPQYPSALRHKYKLLASIDAIDLTAQSLMLAGMTTTIFFQCQDIANIHIPLIMQHADKVSLSAAFGSTIFGTYLEIMKQNFLSSQHESEDEEGESTADHLHSQQPSSNSKDVLPTAEFVKGVDGANISHIEDTKTQGIVAK